jgi:hypothetical protein
MRFGKHPPKHDYRTLALKNYISALELPPASYNVLDNIRKPFTVFDLFPMDGNDQYGDCTIAALAHAMTVYHEMAGIKRYIMSETSVERLYFKLSGGIDSGLNMLDVLNYWRGHGIHREKIFAYVKLNPLNHIHVKQAITLFGGVYVGFQVQQNCLRDFNAGITWSPGRLTNAGHAVYATGYDDTGVSVLTWGHLHAGTWAWWDECVDEAYAILPPEAENVNFHPGLDIAQLKEDLAAIVE